MHQRLLEAANGSRKFVLVLEPGEEAFASITGFATEMGLLGSSLTAIGAFSRAELGWFNPATKEFVKNVVDEQTEVISMMGNITEEHGKVHLHAHVVLGTRDASAKGGHMVAGWVSPTLEVIIEEAPEHMKRGKDRKSGLILLKP
jgi:hypothetical protein